MTARKSPVQDAIWKAILYKGDCEWTSNDIAKESGCKKNSVRDYIRPLLRGGLVALKHESYINPDGGIVPARYVTISRNQKTPVVHGINKERFADHNDG